MAEKYPGIYSGQKIVTLLAKFLSRS